MNKNLLSIAIIVLAIAIVVVNFWKPAHRESEKTSSNQEVTTSEKINNTDEIPGAKLSDLEEGSPAPDFELTTLTGDKMKLSDYKGKKVLLNFWATWCPPCKAEMPHMQKFYENNKDKNIEVVAVNLTNVDKGRSAIENFIKEYELTFQVPLDEQGLIGTTYQAFTIPTSYLVDSNGIIRNKIVGPMDEDTMINLMNEIN